MKKYILLGLFFLLGAVVQLQAQDKKAATAPKAKQPMAYEAFFKQGMRKIGDVFPVYTNDKQYYLEISKNDLGKDLLVSGIIVKGPWCHKSSTITDRICFQLGRNNQLDVVQEIWDVRIDSTKSDPGLVEAFKASNMPSVKFALPIHAFGKDKDSYIIDITKDVTSAGKLFGFPKLQWVNRPVANRFNLDTICPLSKGVKFLVVHAQTDRIPGGMGMPGQDKHNTVRIEWAIQRLPESNMAVREADPRVGCHSLAYADYSEDPVAVKKKSIIRRWKLEVKPEDQAKYEAGELVEPAEPLLVYLDKSIAGGYREAALVAVHEWNEAFADAGFKNVLQVQEGEPEALWGYHTITCSFIEALALVNTVSNPYTGEMIGANMVVSLLDFPKNVSLAKRLLQAYEPRVFSDLKEEVAHQVFRRQFSFQLGQVLGLRANNASRYAYSPEQLRDKEWVAEHGISSSMMDCALVDYLVQPGDGVAFEDLFGHVSHYDRWALEYAYRCFPQGNEKEAIRDLLMEAKGNPYLAYAAKEKDALEPYDLSSDMLEAVKLGMKNIDAAWLQVEQLSAELDEENSWYTYVDLTNGLLETYTSYIVALQQHIGKINIQPSIKGYTDHVWTFMPRAEQKAAADYMIQKTYSGIPEWMQHTRLRGLSGYNGEQTLTYMMRRTSQFVTNPNMLNRLLQTEIEQPGKSYTATELFSAVYKAVFGNFSTSMAINRFNCRAQYLFVEAFVNNYVAADVVKNMGTSVSDFMILQMRKMLDGMERLSKTHATAAGREHYRGLYVFTKQFLASTDQKIKERAAAKKPAAKALTAMQYDGSCNMDWQ